MRAEEIRGCHTVIDIVNIKQAVQAGHLKSYVKDGNVYLQNSIGECVMIGSIDRESTDSQDIHIRPTNQVQRSYQCPSCTLIWYSSDDEPTCPNCGHLIADNKISSDAKQYIRFGDIPEDKISRIHRSDAILGEEKGVSVWDCAEVNGVPFPLLPEGASESAMADYFYMLLGNKPVYLVEGTELDAKGSAGEPLLGDDIHVVREYTEDYDYLKKDKS